MTRSDLFNLVHRVLEARVALVNAERDFVQLNNALMNEMDKVYPLSTNNKKE